MLTHGSLFTGAGGFDLGFEAAGVQTLWQCETNRLARAVLGRHWPGVTRYGDVRKLSGADVEPVHLVSFGSPCQDVSEAGARAGLAGTRSGLYFQALRIITEIQEATGGQYPAYAIWENVPGALTSNRGDDFRTALGALAETGPLDIGWRVLTTSDFGPPQERHRLYVVASYRTASASQVLGDAPRVRWHPTPGGAATSRTKRRPAKRATPGRWYPTRELAGALLHHDGGVCVPDAQAGHLVYDPAGRVRRLTPRECERLQGFPDDHTRYTATGAELTDNARYALTGNAVSPPVAQWLAENIAAVEEATHPDRGAPV